jgi:citrate lyase subunit beta/citryl-CoA lyase/(S)-citramalyl-CoA lyase
MPNFRSLLFVPALKLDRLARAVASGADAICIDLEDAVAPADKPHGRGEAVAHLKAPRPNVTIGVRINAVNTQWHEHDAAEAGRLADFVLAPKIESPEQLAQIAKAAPGKPLWALIETAEGLRRAWDIAAAPTLQGVMFGAFDFSADLGCAMEWEPLLFARGQLAAACGRARVELLDAPSGDLQGGEGLEASTRRAKALGFTGRACIHPAQVGVVNAVYTPSALELAQARRIVDAFDAAAGQAAQMDGKLIELPVALAARRVLERARD